MKNTIETDLQILQEDLTISNFRRFGGWFECSSEAIIHHHFVEQMLNSNSTSLIDMKNNVVEDFKRISEDVAAEIMRNHAHNVFAPTPNSIKSKIIDHVLNRQEIKV